VAALEEDEIEVVKPVQVCPVKWTTKAGKKVAPSGSGKSKESLDKRIINNSEGFF
jgi:hypothetical protein